MRFRTSEMVFTLFPWGHCGRGVDADCSCRIRLWLPKRKLAEALRENKNMSNPVLLDAGELTEKEGTRRSGLNERYIISHRDGGALVPRSTDRAFRRRQVNFKDSLVLLSSSSSFLGSIAVPKGLEDENRAASGVWSQRWKEIRAGPTPTERSSCSKATGPSPAVQLQVSGTNLDPTANE
jgi:hypothetical protein